MDKFGLGVLTACLFTTVEGQKIVDATANVVVKTGNKYLKSLGIDLKSILDNDKEDKEEEEKGC